MQSAMIHCSSRNKSDGSHDANTVSDAVPVESSLDEKCVICQETIVDDDQSVVRMRCCHRFHGQCLCDHLVHDGRCPICRDSPLDDYSFSVDDTANNEPTSVSFLQAIKNAKNNRANCKLTDRMLKTIGKWRKEKKTLSARHRSLWSRIEPLEEAIYEKVGQLEDRLISNLKRREAHTYDSLDQIHTEIVRARTNHMNSMRRVAHKYGYRPLRSSRRSRSSREEEDE